MRLPQHVIRRRQGLYLRLRLPRDIAVFTGRTHLCRSLRTSDLHAARSLAAALIARLDQIWREARLEMTATLRGKGVADLSADDVSALNRDKKATLAEFYSKTEEERVRILADFKRLADNLEAHRDDLRFEVDLTSAVLGVHKSAYQKGTLDGLREAMTSLAGQHASKDEASLEAQASWHSFTDRFFDSKPGMSRSTRASYDQAIAEWQTLIQDKKLSDIKPRDVALYAEWLSKKQNNKGVSGKLNRKTIVQLVGHVRTFTAWAKSAGFLKTDPGADITVRDQTLAEKVAAHEDPKRAFTRPELTELFQSPLFIGSLTRYYRWKPGSHVYRDARWWFFVTALLTGGRVEELAQAPAKLANIDGVPCLDLMKSATKTLSAPRIVPIVPDLARVGFIDYAGRQEAKGHRLFEGEGASEDWSKWTNRYIDKILGVDTEISFHSFRHTFRQACGASDIADYVADKLLGHRNKKNRSEGSSYGRALSGDEALLVVSKFRSPIPLDHLRKLKGR